MTKNKAGTTGYCPARWLVCLVSSMEEALLDAREPGATPLIEPGLSSAGNDAHTGNTST